MTEQDFEYLVPETIEDAVRLRSAHGARAHFISGGTEVVPMMTRGKLREACLIEVSRLPGLTDITGGADGGAIGASVTLTRLRESPVVNRWWMALAEAAGSIREPQVRNRGTIGGNVSHGVPSADLVPPLLVFDAGVVLAGQGGRRVMPLADFLIGPYRTALRPDELVIGVRLAAPDRRLGSAFQKVTKFAGSGLSVATAAAAIRIDGGRIAEARVAIGSAGPVPCRLPAAEAFLVGKSPSDDVLVEAGRMASDAAEPRENSIRATPAHRRRVLIALTARAIALAAQRSGDHSRGAGQ